MPSIDAYAAQCEKCSKWRTIPTEEEYEAIRSKIQETPFICEMKSGMSCDDPPDIEYNASRIWSMEKPGIPKNPKDFKRSLVLRRDFSRMDVYYITPSGKKLRNVKDLSSFIEGYPEYKDVSIADFSFIGVKVMEDTIPDGGNSNKKLKPLKEAA